MIAITAAWAGTALSASGPAQSRPALGTSTWRGIALGAEVHIAFVHDAAMDLAPLVARCKAEIARLEGLFNLYRPDSALSRLNRVGALDDPDQDMLALMSLALALGRETDGAFDVSVQPLWRLYADHFKAPDADPAGPDDEALQAALALVGHRRIRLSPGRIAFDRPGMAVTLNGIAQGYMSDRVAALLRRHGMTNVLVHLGEICALGEKAANEPWTAGIADPADAARLIARVPLRDRALATSAGAGVPFSADGRHHHLFDPQSGRSASHYRSVSVVAPSAAVADGLSTAFAAMPLGRIRTLVAARAETKALILENEGRLITL